VFSLPCGQLCPHIVGRADQPRLSQGAAEDHELAETDGAGFFGNPSIYLWSVFCDLTTDESSERHTHPEQRQGATWDCHDCANTAFAPDTKSALERPHKAPPPSLSSSTGWGLHSVAKEGEACRRCHAKELFVGRKVER